MTVSPKLPQHATEYDDKLSYSMDAMLEVPTNNPNYMTFQAELYGFFKVSIINFI